MSAVRFRPRPPIQQRKARYQTGSTLFLLAGYVRADVRRFRKCSPSAMSASDNSLRMVLRCTVVAGINRKAPRKGLRRGLCRGFPVRSKHHRNLTLAPCRNRALPAHCVLRQSWGLPCGFWCLYGRLGKMPPWHNLSAVQRGTVPPWVTPEIPRQHVLKSPAARHRPMGSARHTARPGAAWRGACVGRGTGSVPERPPYPGWGGCCPACPSTPWA